MSWIVFGVAALGMGRAADASLVVRDLGTLGGSLNVPNGINDAGQVVGTSLNSSGQQRAFLFSGGVMTDLNSLLDPGSGWTILEARGINDRGQIAAYGFNASTGVYHALLLESEVTVVPEPSALVSVGMGALVCLTYARRRRRAAA